mgnify:CR=1 FL=1
MKNENYFEVDNENLEKVSGGGKTIIIKVRSALKAARGEDPLVGEMEVKDGKIVKEWGIIPDKYRKAALEK